MLSLMIFDKKRRRCQTERTCHHSLTSPVKVSFQLISSLRNHGPDVNSVFLVELSIRPDLNRQLVPSFSEPELASQGIDLNNFKPIPLEELRISLD